MTHSSPQDPVAPVGRLTAVAHDVRSLHNVGAIFRTADGAGFDSVLLSGFTGAPPDPRIAKVALGADESLTHAHVGSLDDLLRHLQGYWVVLLEQLASSSTPQQVELPQTDQPIALVVASEISGAPARLVGRADAVMEIPMRGEKESLNVSVAFGIASYAIADRVLDPQQHHLRSRALQRKIRPGVLTGDPWRKPD